MHSNASLRLPSPYPLPQAGEGNTVRRKMAGMHPFRSVLFFVAFALGTNVSAATAYRCVDAHGAISFQDTPCAIGARQSKLALPDTPAPAPAPANDADAAPPPAPPPPRDVKPLPPDSAPIAPSVYLCTRYDGTRYISDDGHGGSVA